MTAHTERSAHIDRIVNRVRRELERHAVIDDQRIIHDHPELMPDLEQRLTTLREVLAVARAGEPVSNDTAEAYPGEDLEVLAAALPSYTFEECIAQGGQGTVYRAVHRPSARTVAFKLLIDGPLATRRQRARFQDEMALVGRLAHPGIVTLVDSGVARGRLYYAMEYVEGLPVDAHVCFNTMNVRATLTLFIAICDAVNYAHEQGVVHHDLKPTNVLIDEHGQPRILDLGLAREPRSFVSSVTTGTIDALRFRPVEEIQALTAGHRVDPRGDIYALGVMLFNALTDTFPYELNYDGDTPRLSAGPVSLRTALATHTCARIATADISDDLEAVVHRAIANNIDHRYDSARALAEDLQNVLDGTPVNAPPVHPAPAPARRPALMGLGCCGFVGLVIGFGWLLWPRSQEPLLQAPGVLPITARSRDAAADLLDRVDRQLVDSASSGAAVDRGLIAEVSEHRGDVAFERGRHTEATEHYRAVLAASEQPSAHGDDGQRRLIRARAHRKLGRSLDTPADHFDVAAGLCQQLIADGHMVRSATMELAMVTADIAQHDLETGAYADALTHAEQARATVPQFEHDGNDAALLELQATTWGIAGRALMKLGRREEARQALARSLDIRDTLVKANDLEPRRLLAYVIACKNAGDSLRNDGHTDRAEELYADAIEIGERLCRLDPSAVHWQYELYGAYDRHARLYLKLKDIENAQRFAERASDLSTAILNTEPNNIRWQRISGFSELLLGRTLIARGKTSEALASFQRAVRIRGTVSKDDPSNLEWKLDLAIAHEYLGRCWRVIKDYPKSLDHYRQALNIRMDIEAILPDSIDATLGTIRSLNSLAAWHISQKDPGSDEEAEHLLADASSRLFSSKDKGYWADDHERFEQWKNVINGNLAIVRKRATVHESQQ